MKEETRIRQEEYKVYITDDGKEFTNKQKAEKHEAELLPKKQIPNYYLGFNIIEDAHVYKIESEEDLEYLAATEWKEDTSYWTYDGPDWYIALRHDGGDYPDDYNVLPVKSYIRGLQYNLNALKELETKEKDERIC